MDRTWDMASLLDADADAMQENAGAVSSLCESDVG